MKSQLKDDIVANKKISAYKLAQAREIILNLQKELPQYIKKGYGPFLAAIYDDKGKLLVKAANSVLLDKCSHRHAEMNVIKMAEKALNTHDLSKYNLRLYVTAEPCMMCLGAILWSGIKEVYFGVSSQMVQDITGFDEGFKPNWSDEFKQRGIAVCGYIEPESGAKVLRSYVKGRRPIYKPTRNPSN